MPIFERYRTQLNTLKNRVDKTSVLQAYRAIQDRVKSIGQVVENLMAADRQESPTPKIETPHSNKAGDITDEAVALGIVAAPETKPAQKTRKRRIKKVLEV